MPYPTTCLFPLPTCLPSHLPKVQYCSLSIVQTVAQFTCLPPPSHQVPTRTLTRANGPPYPSRLSYSSSVSHDSPLGHIQLCFEARFRKVKLKPTRSSLFPRVAKHQTADTTMAGEANKTNKTSYAQSCARISRPPIANSSRAPTYSFFWSCSLSQQPLR